MKKKILSIFLCLCMIVGMMPAVEVRAEGGNVVSTLDDLKAAIANENYSYIQIADNITITETLEIPEGRTVTIQSNGSPYKLIMNSAGALFNVKGSLTLQNVVIEATGYSTDSPKMAIKVDGSSATVTLRDGVTIQKFTYRDHAIVSIVNGASLTMEEGSKICNNTTYMNGGGVYVTNGTFTMNGGIISDNESNSYGTGKKYGGGVYITGSNSVFNMNGGSIESNFSRTGGGLCIENGATFNMNGGSITNNSADYGGGIYMFDGTFNIGGNVTIKDNKEGSKDSNIDLRAGNVVNVVADLTNAEPIGLSLNFGENNVLYTKEVFTVVACSTEEAATANVGKFKSDNVCHPISTNETNMDMEVPGYEVTVAAGTGMACSSGAAEQTVIAGTELAGITYNVNDDYYFPEGYTVSGLDGTGISVTRNSYTQITISGTPTGDVTINLPAATEKTEQKPQPTGVTFVATGAKTGELRGASREMEYLTWAGYYWQLGEGTRVFDSLSAGDTITVRTKGGDTVKPSEPIVFSLTQKETPAGVTAVACSEAGVNDGRLLGVTSVMEYKKYNEADDSYDPGHYDPEMGQTPNPDVSNWISGTGSDITGLEAGKYRVRVKAEGTALASEEILVTIAESGGATVNNYTISATAQPSTGGSIVGTGVYPEGTEVTLTATPNTGCKFVNWTENDVEVSTGASITFTVEGNRALVANFEEDATGEGGNGSVPNPDPNPTPNPGPTPPYYGGGSGSAPSYSDNSTIVTTEADGTRVKETTTLQPDNTKLKTIEKTKPDGTIITTKVVLDASNNMVSSKAVVKVSGEVVENTSKLGFEATDNMITEVKTMVSNHDTTITFVVLAEANKVAYKVVVDTEDLKVGNQLYVTALDRKTGEYTLVNKKYTVSEENELDISMSVKKKYFLIDKAEMEEMTDKILKTVILEEKNVSMAKGDRIKIAFSDELNRLNVKSIVYDNKSEDMIAVSSNGFVRAKRTGKAKVKVVVKLKNGVTKTLTMTLNIK